MPSILSGVRKLFAKDAPPPDNSALKKQGNDLLAQGRIAEAMACYEQAVEMCPDDAAAHVNLGYTALASGDAALAERVLRSATRLDPSVADGWFMLGQALNATSQWAEAEPALRQALALQPQFPFAQHELARVLADMGRRAEALDMLEPAMETFAEDAAAWHLRGNLQFACKRFAEAAESYAKAMALHPDFVEAMSNRAVCLNKLGRRDEARPLFERALQLRPLYPAAVYNLGLLMLDEGRCDEVVALSDEALRAHPDEADIHVNRADALLLQGRLGEAWADYEWRWRAQGLGVRLQRPSLPSTLWSGREQIAAKTVLLLPEQGLGDSIQFLRYAPVLVQRGAKVLMQLPPALEPLVEGMPGVVLVRAGQPLPPHDFHITLPSLPMAMGTTLQTIPAAIPYLHSDAQLRVGWEEWLGPRRGPRVGLVWSGNAAHSNDAHRSIALAALMADAPQGVRWVSLHKEVRESDQEALRNTNILHAGDRLTSFAQTAALVDCMDVVISVDTSVAHLAGALGRPLWLMLPFRPDWRWMFGRDDSPWYPTARLFRQDERREWGPVVERVMAAVQSDLVAQQTRGAT